MEITGCRLPLEETTVGKLKKRFFDIPNADIEDLLQEYGIPSKRSVSPFCYPYKDTPPYL